MLAENSRVIEWQLFTQEETCALYPQLTLALGGQGFSREGGSIFLENNRGEVLVPGIATKQLPRA